MQRSNKEGEKPDVCLNRWVCKLCKSGYYKEQGKENDNLKDSAIEGFGSQQGYQNKTTQGKY